MDVADKIASVTMPKIMTPMTAIVQADRETEFLSGYRGMNASEVKPEALLRSELLRGQDGRWYSRRCGAIATP
ncbi:MAG: hypothetical protein ABJA86_10815 [Nocardioidaceae bacterium]